MVFRIKDSNEYNDQQSCFASDLIFSALSSEQPAVGPPCFRRRAHHPKTVRAGATVKELPHHPTAKGAQFLADVSTAHARQCLKDACFYMLRALPSFAWLYHPCPRIVNLCAGFAAHDSHWPTTTHHPTTTQCRCRSPASDVGGVTVNKALNLGYWPTLTRLWSGGECGRCITRPTDRTWRLETGDEHAEGDFTKEQGYGVIGRGPKLDREGSLELVVQIKAGARCS